MVAVTATIDQRQMESARRMLVGVRRGLPRAATRAINKVARHYRSLVVKEIAAKTGMRQKDIRKRNVRLTLANYTSLQATLRLFSKAVKAIRFAACKGKTGASWMVDGLRTTFAHTFVATMPTGHVGVFKRRTQGPGSKRLPIDEQYGPNPLDLIDVNDLQARSDRDLAAEFETQVDLVLEQAARG